MNDFIEELKKDTLERRNELIHCPICRAKISDRTVSLYSGLMDALYRVYCWCGEKRKHEFETKEIKYLLGKNEYARFGDLVRFGGVVYKPEEGKAHFGLNMQRARSFFQGEYKIPVQIVLNQITNQIVEATYVSVKDFPELYELLNKEGLYDYEKVVTEKVNIDWERQKKAGLPPVGEPQKQLSI